MYARNEPPVLDEITQAGLAPNPPRRLNPAANLSAGMLENNRMTRPKRALDYLVSIIAHTAVVALAIIVPLLFSNAIAMPKLDTTYLLAPPPPPPPPPAVVKTIPRPRITMPEDKLYVPRVIPKVIAQVKETATPPQIAAGVLGGVVGGVPGGQVGGVIGGILAGTLHQFAPPPPKPKAPAPHGPYLVGGLVQPPRLIHEVQPVYPILAMETRTEGNVLIDCIINKSGNVTDMKIVSGNPLLDSAAMNAVQQWQYSPTLLNGKPVSVQMIVTVNFSLQG